jgi:uncharacterized protein (TIGR01777 family)
VSALKARGHEIVALVRRQPDSSVGQVYWNPEIGVLDRGALEGLDAVVHLAGENIASGRWSAKRKAKIRNSRVVGTTLLSESLAALTTPPGVLVSASAIGFYGNCGADTLDEDSAAGTGFAADLARDWETATDAAARAGIRVVKLRIGVVLGAAGGALAKMLPPFRLGLGGRLGDGRQIMSWIALADVVRVVQFAIESSAISGAVNATAPNPVSNAEFTRALGRVLGRPTPFPVPAFALRLVFGEMADEILLCGADVRPRKLQQSGFVFEHPDLEDALRSELGRVP